MYGFYFSKIDFCGICSGIFTLKTFAVLLVSLDNLESLKIKVV